MPDDDLDPDDERHARSIAKRRTANILLVVVCFLLLADVVVPDEQYHLDPIAFPITLAAVLLLNDVNVPWGGGHP